MANLLGALGALAVWIGVTFLFPLGPAGSGAAPAARRLGRALRRW